MAIRITHLYGPPLSAAPDSLIDETLLQCKTTLIQAEIEYQYSRTIFSSIQAGVIRQFEASPHYQSVIFTQEFRGSASVSPPPSTGALKAFSFSGSRTTTWTRVPFQEHPDYAVPLPELTVVLCKGFAVYNPSITTPLARQRSTYGATDVGDFSFARRGPISSGTSVVGTATYQGSPDTNADIRVGDFSPARAFLVAEPFDAARGRGIGRYEFEYGAAGPTPGLPISFTPWAEAELLIEPESLPNRRDLVGVYEGAWESMVPPVGWSGTAEGRLVVEITGI